MEGLIDLNKDAVGVLVERKNFIHNDFLKRKADQQHIKEDLDELEKKIQVLVKAEEALDKAINKLKA